MASAKNQRRVNESAGRLSESEATPCCHLDSKQGRTKVMDSPRDGWGSATRLRSRNKKNRGSIFFVKKKKQDHPNTPTPNPSSTMKNNPAERAKGEEKGRKSSPAISTRTDPTPSGNVPLRPSRKLAVLGKAASFVGFGR